MKKFITKVVAIYVFLQTPRGKRDLGIVTAAVGTVVSVLKQFGLI